MPIPSSIRLVAQVLVPAALAVGCATLPTPMATAPAESRAVEIDIVVTPKEKNIIPKGARIIIADIAGPCGQEVKDALMKRLVDNADYTVVTRENLDQIADELERSWAGKFNTETAGNLGKLLGASRWIVGRVSYCGASLSEGRAPRAGSPVNVLAALQVIDIETGKVLVASASEGRHVPLRVDRFDFERARSGKSAQSQPADEPAEPSGRAPEVPLQGAETGPAVPSGAGDAPGRPGEAGDGSRRRLSGVWENFRAARAGASAAAMPLPAASSRAFELAAEAERYPIVAAADALAGGFADKFFARPQWYKVVLWDSPRWPYSEAIRLVKLGQCPLALEIMERVGSAHLEEMSAHDERDVAEYLHNYGVTLLCANQPERAAEKLRSAFRLETDPRSREMLGLAAKVVEWSLLVEVDQQPEVKMLVASEPVPTGN
jgi:curli biogenesis system outer membrane secretion channel CsgG